jgi:hypothetical protein
MIQGRGGARFTQETRAHVISGTSFRRITTFRATTTFNGNTAFRATTVYPLGKNFDSDRAQQIKVSCAKDDPHRTATDLTIKPVTPAQHQSWSRRACPNLIGIEAARFLRFVSRFGWRPLLGFGLGFTHHSVLAIYDLLLLDVPAFTWLSLRTFHCK